MTEDELNKKIGSIQGFPGSTNASYCDITTPPGGLEPPMGFDIDKQAKWCHDRDMVYCNTGPLTMPLTRNFCQVFDPEKGTFDPSDGSIPKHGWPHNDQCGNCIDHHTLRLPKCAKKPQQTPAYPYTLQWGTAENCSSGAGGCKKTVSMSIGNNTTASDGWTTTSKVTASDKLEGVGVTLEEDVANSNTTSVGETATRTDSITISIGCGGSNVPASGHCEGATNPAVNYITTCDLGYDDQCTKLDGPLSQAKCVTNYMWPLQAVNPNTDVNSLGYSGGGSFDTMENIVVGDSLLTVCSVSNETKPKCYPGYCSAYDPFCQSCKDDTWTTDKDKVTVCNIQELTGADFQGPEYKNARARAARDFVSICNTGRCPGSSLQGESNILLADSPPNVRGVYHATLTAAGAGKQCTHASSPKTWDSDSCKLNCCTGGELPYFPKAGNVPRTKNPLYTFCKGRDPCACYCAETGELSTRTGRCDANTSDDVNPKCQHAMNVAMGTTTELSLESICRAPMDSTIVSSPACKMLSDLPSLQTEGGPTGCCEWNAPPESCTI